MSPAERNLAEDRATCQAAHKVFDARLARVRTALADRGLGSRLTDEAKSRARTAADETVEAARDARWVMISTGLALLAWFLRRPLAASAQHIARRVRK